MANLSQSKAGLKPSGIYQAWIKYTSAAGVADAGYYQLPFIKNGKTSWDTAQETSSIGQELPYAFDFTATFDSMVTNKTNILKVLDTISTGQIDFCILPVADTTGAAIAISSAGVTPAFTGLIWEFVCEGDMKPSRYIQWTFQRSFLMSDQTNVIKAAPTLTGATGTDALNAMNSLVRADIIPAGFKSVTCSAKGGNKTDDNFGYIRNAKLRMKLQTENDQYARPQGYNVHISISFEAMQTAAADLTQMEVIAARENDYAITLMDGTVITLASQLGITWKYNNDKDSTGMTYSTVSGSGIVPTSALDGIFV